MASPQLSLHKLLVETNHFGDTDTTLSTELCELLSRTDDIRDAEIPQFVEKCVSVIQARSSIVIDTKLTAKSWKALIAVLATVQSHLQHLVFLCDLSDDEAVSLGEVLERGVFSALQTLHFCPGQLHLQRAASKAVARALAYGGLDNLSSLVLPNCDVWEIMAVLCSKKCDLTSLSVGFSSRILTQLFEESFDGQDRLDGVSRDRIFSNALSESKTWWKLGDCLTSYRFVHLQHLQLVNEALGGHRGFQVLTSGITSGHLREVKFLSLSGSPMSLKNANLRDLVVQDLVVEYLHLDGCGIYSGQVSNLVKAVLSDKRALSLQSLNLEGNALTDMGVTSLVSLAIAGFLPQLRQLDLSSNRLRISSDPFVELMSAIERGHLPSLLTLGWKENGVYDRGAEAIVRAYLQNRTLIANIEIDWSRIGFGDLSLKTKASEYRDRNVRLRQAKEELKEKFGEDVQDLDEVKGKLGEDLFGKYLDEVPVTSAKVFLCGFSEVGKTTLRMSLERYLGRRTKLKLERHQGIWKFRWSKIPRTRGIELRRIQKKKTNGDSLTLVLWDLAGQEEFHVMHGTFVPDLGLAAGETTTFVIVFRAPFNKAVEAELLYWLRFVASSSLKDVKRHVVIVLNCFHGKRCPDHEQSLWRELITKFVVMFHDLLHIHPTPFSIDARFASSVKDLKEHLFFHAETLLEDVRMPRICLKLLEKLKGLSEGENQVQFPILSWEAFESRLELKSGLIGKALRAAAHYLHEIGEIIFLTEDGRGTSSAESRCLVVPDPEWFCRLVVGQLLLPKKMLEDGETSVTKFLGDDGSISKVQFQAFFKYALAQRTRVEDVFSMLERMGLCYRMGEEKILVPALIQRDDLSAINWERQGVHWVMGRSLTTREKARTAFPMTLFRRFQVELAQDERFGGLGDSKYRAGKSYSTFRLGRMVVLIQFDVNPSDPIDDRFDILVKSLIREEDPELMRVEQLECISAIMHELERLCVDCCPGVQYDRMAIKPWSAAEESVQMSKRELLSVREIKSRIQKHGIGKYTTWEVRGEQVKEVTLLSLHELEEIQVSSAQLYNTLKQDALTLGLFPANPLSELQTEVESISASTLQPVREDNALDIDHVPIVTQNNSVKVEELSLGSECREVITKGFLRQELYNVTQTIVETVRNDGKLTREHLDKWSKELGDSLWDFQQKQNLLLKHVQAVQSFSIEEQEQSVPRYMFLSKHDKNGKSTLWITLTEAFQTAFQLHLLCEARYQDGLIHEVKNQEGIEVKKSREWLVKISPWLQWSLKVAIVVSKIAGQILIPGIGILIPGLPVMEGENLAKVVDSAATELDKELGKEQVAEHFEGKYGSAERPINLKERLIAEAVLGDLMREVGNTVFAKKIGLRKVLLNERVQRQIHTSPHGQGQPCVVWICNDCYVKYGPAVKDITLRI